MSDPRKPADGDRCVWRRPKPPEEPANIYLREHDRGCCVALLIMVGLAVFAWGAF